MRGLKEAVIELLRKVPAEPGYAIPPGTSEQTIEGFEARTGLKIPSELREWLKITNGPVVGPGGLFGINPARRDMDIEEIYRLYPQWKQKRWIPIGGDGSGNYYLTAADGDRRGVFFVDTEEDGDRPTYIVASSIWMFLYFLFQREMGERGWPFDKERVLAEDPSIGQLTAFTMPWDA